MITEREAAVLAIVKSRLDEYWESKALWSPETDRLLAGYEQIGRLLTEGVYK